MRKRDSILGWSVIVNMQIKFPVVMFTREWYHGCEFVENYKTLEGIQTVAQITYEEGYVLGAKIVDADGKLYVVKNVNFAKVPTFFSRFLETASRREILVDFELVEISQLTLEEFKCLIIDAYKRNTIIEYPESIKYIKCTADTFAEVMS